jgi:hypothetical protein
VLDLLTAIDRRMSYVERAIPIPLLHTKKSNAELASQLHYVLPVLASRSARAPGGDSHEVICVPLSAPAQPQSNGGPSAPTEREKLARLLEILEIANNRRLVALGKTNLLLKPFVYVFSGKKIYAQDSTGRRELRVDGDCVESRLEGHRFRYWVDGVEISRTGLVIAR